MKCPICSSVSSIFPKTSQKNNNLKKKKSKKKSIRPKKENKKYSPKKFRNQQISPTDFPQQIASRRPMKCKSASPLKLEGSNKGCGSSLCRAATVDGEATRKSHGCMGMGSQSPKNCSQLSKYLADVAKWKFRT